MTTTDALVPICASNPLVDALTDEVFLYLCTLLPGRDLVALGGTCRELHQLVRSSTHVWRELVTAHLGEPLVELHRAAWGFAGDDGDGAPVANPMDADSADFYRVLFRAATECSRLAHANALRPRALAHLSRDDVERLLCTTGHTATGLGHFVAIVGGWRRHCDLAHLHVSLVDVSGPKLIEPTLAPGSAQPARRIRAAACAIARPSWLARRADEPSSAPCALVLGGCDDDPAGSREPVGGGLHTLTVLALASADGARVRWHEASASGEAPRAIWHHDCGAFAGGSRVVVFGGDMPESDPEFEHIRERRAAHVYVLELEQRAWARVPTSGSVPTWRSLHVAVTHTSLVDGREQLVVLGGTEEHTEVFSSGPAAPFLPHALDLGSFSWRAGRPGSYLPAARMRFAAERYGNYLVVFGGHGNERISRDEALVRLDLRSLSWDRLPTRNSPYSHANTPAARLCSGVLCGGVQFTLIGVQLVPKLELLILDEPIAERAKRAEREGHATIRPPAWEGEPQQVPPGDAEERCVLS